MMLITQMARKKKGGRSRGDTDRTTETRQEEDVPRHRRFRERIAWDRRTRLRAIPFPFLEVSYINKRPILKILSTMN